METFTGFKSPNYTETPNELFDELLSKIEKLCELKVTLVAIRQTFGWHKVQAELSISLFEKATNLSRNSVREGIALALERGTLVEIEPETNRDGAIYAVAMSDSVAKHTVGGARIDTQSLTPTNRGVKSYPPRDAKVDPQNLTPIKKDIDLKEIKEKDGTEIQKQELKPLDPLPESSGEMAEKNEIRDRFKDAFFTPYDFNFSRLYQLIDAHPDPNLHRAVISYFANTSRSGAGQIHPPPRWAEYSQSLEFFEFHRAKKEHA